MNEFRIDELTNRLESVLLNIIYTGSDVSRINPTLDQINDAISILNAIFPENKCVSFMYTNNTDRPFFGIKVFPVITPTDAITILATDEKVKFKDYKIEIDSRVFEDLNMETVEIIAYLLYEISSTVNSFTAIDKVRASIDGYMVTNDDVLCLRNSIIYAQLMIFAIKDTLSKVSSIIYNQPEMFLANNIIQALGFDNVILSVHDKITGKLLSTGNDIAFPKSYILTWMFNMYKDMRLNSDIMVDTLKNAKLCTGSKLEKDEIDATIKAINRIDVTVPVNPEVNLQESLTQVITKNNIHSLNELSLFKNLRMSGLKSIENDYYEYAMMIKNCDTEEDAMYIMRGINTRLNILEDYLNNTPDLSKSEVERWSNLSRDLRQLRYQLMKNKIWKRSNYGLFFDYNQEFGD